MAGGTLDHESLDRLISEACEGAPLPFLRQFLREQRGRGRRIGIGAAAKQARENLRDAIAAKLIGTSEVVVHSTDRGHIASPTRRRAT